jgi:signal peptidase I
MKKIWNEIKDYIFIILAVVLIRTFIITPAIVDGASMDNTLENGQLVLINKFIYRFDDINRFDIVVINNDEDSDKIIKRVIGLPNEIIEYRDNVLYINGKKIETEIDFIETDDFIAKTGENEYFVLGDNRPISKDSRYFGNFKKDDIIGRVTIRLYPFSKFGLVK